MKTVFTTGEAAKICKVSQQTIIRCFDSGQLKGFRVPGSRFRRIPREQLYAFMRDNGIPTAALESGKRKVLIVDDDQELVELLADALDKDGRFEVRTVNNGFDAGMLVKEYYPDLIVLDVMLPDINGKEVCQRVRSDKTLDDVRIICISGMLEQDRIEDLGAAGANDFLQKPFYADVLIERMCALLDIEAVLSGIGSGGWHEDAAGSTQVLVRTTQTYYVELDIDRDFDGFTWEDAEAIAGQLQSQYGWDSRPRIVGVDPGSVKLLLELTPEQADDIERAIRNGDLLGPLKVNGGSKKGKAALAALFSAKKKAKLYDVFMCYNRTDRAAIERLAKRLCDLGIVPWLDIHDAPPGRRWQKALEETISNVKSAAVFVGSSGVGPWQDMEIDALLVEFANRACPVIPVLLSKCPTEPPLPMFLRSMSWVDFNDNGSDPMGRLIWGIKGSKPQGTA